MDIFPANVIDNITVYKTFLPNLTGDYTGGLVDISTKDFPSKKTFFIKAGLGYNTASTFNKDYLSYNGGAFYITTNENAKNFKLVKAHYFCAKQIKLK